MVMPGSGSKGLPKEARPREREVPSRGEGLPPGTGAGAGAGPGVAPAVMGDVGRAVDRDLKLATRGLTPIRGPVGGLASCGIVWDRARGEPARGLPAPPALRGEAPRTEPRLDDEMEELGRYTTGGDMSRGVIGVHVSNKRPEEGSL